MFILQSYKYYIPNQKNQKKISWNCKKMKEPGERMLFIVVPRLGSLTVRGEIFFENNWLPIL